MLGSFPLHRFQRKSLVSDRGMHHGTCVTHVLWCMLGSLTRRHCRRMRNPLLYASGKRHMIKPHQDKPNWPVWHRYRVQCQILKKYLQVRRTSYFWALWSFQVFVGSLFKIKLHLRSTVLLRGFQSSQGFIRFLGSKQFGHLCIRVN